jgi:hypothetical protein
MNARKTIGRLRELIPVLVAADCRAEVVVWRHPGETEDEAIDRHIRQHPTIAKLRRSAIHVVSWESSGGR